jgi:hypothetical protein
MKELITVVDAQHVRGHLLKLRFSDGTEKTVDFSRWLRGDVFRPLTDLKQFKQFFISGGTVCWPNGADIAPERLRDAEDASGGSG